MKILMTSSGGIIRGIESWPEYGLASELVGRGFDVTVISSSSAARKHDVRMKETIDGIKVARFNPVLPGSFFYMLRKSFDLIHMHHLGYLAPISSYAALRNKLRSTPSVFTIHGLYHDPYIVGDVEDPLSGRLNHSVQNGFPIAPWRMTNWFVHLPLQAKKITALTHWEKNETRKLGIAPEKIEIIPNGVHIRKFKARAGNFFRKMGIQGKILLFVGQPSDRKGWRYFLEAMPLVLRDHPDAKAVFIGYRHDRAILEKCLELKIDKSVVFLGYLPEQEKIHAFQSADIFVLPTLYEGFGIVFIEAMASGLPIVTTNTAGNGEIVENGKNGLLVQPKNSQQIAMAIRKILGNQSIRNKMRHNNLQKAKTYDWKDVAKKYIALYEETK